MKNLATCFSLLLLLLAASIGVAQSEFTGGIIAGAVTTQVSGDGLGGWNKFGGTGGAWVNMSFSERYGLTMAMQFVQKGSRKPADPGNGDYNTFAYRLNYIDVPVMVSYKRASARTPIQFNAGLYAGVLISQEQLYNGSTTGITPPFNGYDIGAAGGASLWLGERSFVEFRISTSILPSRNSPNPTNAWSYYEQGNYNQVLHLMYGFGF
ncbi:MAG: PorT family protein [Flavobacteriales bacterium]|nr:PorT family protein [Flavobacteriales bacterium]